MKRSEKVHASFVSGAPASRLDNARGSFDRSSDRGPVRTAYAHARAGPGPSEPHWYHLLGMSDSTVDTNELLVLHALRLRGFADLPVVAEAAHLNADIVEPVLATAAEAELVRYREGRMTGYMLTPAGRARGEEMLADELNQVDGGDAVAAAYQDFLKGNQDFLGLCTDWQTRTVDGSQVINDHLDTDYDAGIIGRLADTDAGVQPICAALASVLPRFGSYSPRFGNALALVQSGEKDWFTKPTIQSYHTVWFELHEDLLATLGIERSKEGHST